MSRFSDIALLLSRILLALVLITHGWTKFNDLAATAQGFASMGVPLATASAVATAAIELIGGVLILLGIGTRIVSGIVVLLMIGAYAFAHLGAPVAEFQAAALVASAALALLAAGPGRIAIDALLGRPSREDEAKAAA